VWSPMEAVLATAKRKIAPRYPQNVTIRTAKEKTANAAKETRLIALAKIHALPKINNLSVTMKPDAWAKMASALLAITRGVTARRSTAPRNGTHHSVTHVEAREVTVNAPAFLKRITFGKDAHVWIRRKPLFTGRRNPR
jgi:hypothetical protein